MVLRGIDWSLVFGVSNVLPSIYLCLALLTSLLASLTLSLVLPVLTLFGISHKYDTNDAFNTTKSALPTESTHWCLMAGVRLLTWVQTTPLCVAPFRCLQLWERSSAPETSVRVGSHVLRLSVFRTCRPDGKPKASNLSPTVSAQSFEILSDQIFFFLLHFLGPTRRKRRILHELLCLVRRSLADSPGYLPVRTDTGLRKQGQNLAVDRADPLASGFAACHGAGAFR